MDLRQKLDSQFFISLVSIKRNAITGLIVSLGIQEKIEIFKNATERKVFGTVGICDEEKNSVLILNRIFQNFEIMFTGGLGNSTGGLGQSVSNQYDFHNVSHLSHLLYPHKILLFLFRSVIILIKLVAG